MEQSANFGTLKRAGNHTWSASNNNYFIANDVKMADKQQAVLLAVGGQTYQLICNLLVPTKPMEVTFAEIVDAVQKQVQP